MWCAEAGACDHGVCCLRWVEVASGGRGCDPSNLSSFSAFSDIIGVCNSPEKGSTLGASCYKQKARARGSMRCRRRSITLVHSAMESCTDNVVEDEIAQSTSSDRGAYAHTESLAVIVGKAIHSLQTLDLTLNGDRWR